MHLYCLTRHVKCVAMLIRVQVILVHLFILFPLFLGKVYGFSDAILLEKGEKKVLLFGDLHGSQLDERNGMDVKAFFEKFDSMVGSSPFSKFYFRESITYYEYEELIGEGSTAALTPLWMRRLSKKYLNHSSRFRFIPFEPRSDIHQYSASFEGVMLNVVTFLKGDLDMSWAEFKKLVSGHFYKISPYLSMDGYLQVIGKNRSQYPSESLGFSLEEVSYLKTLEQELKDSYSECVREFSSTKKEHFLDTLFRYLEQGQQKPNYKTIAEQHKKLYHLLAVNLDFKVFDYVALYQILKNLNQDQSRALILVSGHAHTQNLKKHFINLGFTIKESSEAQVLKFKGPHGLDGEQYSIERFDVARYLDQVHYSETIAKRAEALEGLIQALQVLKVQDPELFERIQKF